MKETDEKRKGIIGIYTDRVALSVMEGQETCYSIYRKQEERDFFTGEGKLELSSLIEGIMEMGDFAKRLCCDEILCQGYGLLRYHQELTSLLKQKLSFPVESISGARQGEVFSRQIFPKGIRENAAGFWSGDMSTQLVRQDNHRQKVESFPLGWRLLEQEGILVPGRAGEEKMRQQIRSVFRVRGITIKEEKELLLAGGLDQAADFLMMIGDSRAGELSIAKETLRSVFRLMRKDSLRWFPMLERASAVFPQKIFCQLMILEQMMELTGADQAKLCRVCLEDGISSREISQC